MCLYKIVSISTASTFQQTKNSVHVSTLPDIKCDTLPTKQRTRCIGLFRDFFIDFFFYIPWCVFYHLHVISDWLIFEHFPTKNSAFLAACQIQNYRNRKLKRDRFLKITLPEKLLTDLYTNGRISKSRRSMNLILVSAWNGKCVSYNDTKNLLVPFFVGVHHKYAVTSCPFAGGMQV